MILGHQRAPGPLRLQHNLVFLLELFAKEPHPRRPAQWRVSQFYL
jgi:hypothetical protein